MNQQQQMQLMDVLLAPHITEKATGLADANRQFVFKVRTDADKTAIKNAVELMFDVKVTGVQVARVKGKKKRFSATMGKRKDWKKAYVTLAEGSDIDFMGAE